MKHRRMVLGVLGGLAALALFAPMLLLVFGIPGPGQIDSSSLSSTFGEPTGPSAAHLLGVDWLGRDVLSRTVFGLRSSLAVTAIAVLFAMIVGTAAGMVAGYRGGMSGWTISRAIELFLVLPYVVLAAGIATSCSRNEGCLGGTVRPGVLLTGIVIGLATWPFVARVVRDRTQQLRNANFVEAARLQGSSESRILLTEIFPNLVAPLSVLAVILLPQAILAEAGLTFLGIGLPAEVPSWGGMIASGAPLFPDAWWVLVFPGLVLLAVVLSFSLLIERGRYPGRIGGINRP